ncbi:MAG: metal-binding protein [Candidatus Thermoplasmatota archaeon]|jgi:hypothetical protein|nr:metal-binding protein [Candidatus Thermoplasmatota archaeon]
MAPNKQSYLDRILVFDKIVISRPVISDSRISSTIGIFRGKSVEYFKLIFSYREKVAIDQNLAGLILTMPVINFSYFSRKLELDFPVTETDLNYIRKVMKINNREVFINAICRRRYNFYKPVAIPSDEEITESNANGITELTAAQLIPDPDKTESLNRWIGDRRKSAVLSSGGKESLLTYSILKEIGMDVHPIFFNESGAHWRAAKPSFESFTSNNQNTTKVWSNADRFYRFCINLLPFLNHSLIRKRTDTYPVQMFTFPVYVFSILPILIKRSIPLAFMGNEFDDPSDMPSYHGLSHYSGIYDQTLDFTDSISQYIKSKGCDISLSSILYPVTATIVERMLVRRYHDIFLLQRSCHSCSIIQNKVIPCGKCSKCLGVIMLILAAGGKPEEIGYTESSIDLAKRSSGSLRLDTDEIRYLYSGMTEDSHVTGIHVLPDENEPLSHIDPYIREKILIIFHEYCKGQYYYRKSRWVRS